MNLIPVLRYAVKTIATLSVKQVVENLVVATTPEVMTPVGKIMTKVGSSVLSAYIGNEIGEFVTKEIDDLLAAIKAAKQKLDEEQSKTVPEKG